jgi:hypothetical protein
MIVKKTMSISLFPQSIQDNYEILEYRNGISILKHAYPDEWEDLINLLDSFVLKRSEILTPGGRKSSIADKLDGFLYSRGWNETEFDVDIRLREIAFIRETDHKGKPKIRQDVKDDVTLDVPTHKIDCFKNKVAIEVEWNNKDPFFDRDLNNFRLLFDLDAIAVGVIITRSSELQTIFNELGKGDSYGASTTHMGKLESKLFGKGSGGCPVIAIGITTNVYDDLS